MEGCRTISLTLTQRPTSKLLFRKRRYKYISRLSSSNNGLTALTPQKFRIFRTFKTLYAYSQLSFTNRMLFPSLRQTYKTTRHCVMSSDNMLYPRTYGNIKKFVVSNKNLESLRLPLSPQTAKLLGKNPNIKKICLALYGIISTKNLLVARNRLNRQRKLESLDLEGTSAELDGVKYLYKGAHDTKNIGVYLSKITKKATRLNFLGPKTSKISLANIPYEPAMDILKNLSKFTKLQILTLRRIENNLPENYAFGEFAVLQDLHFLKELNLVLYLGSINLTENFLKGLKLPPSLEHLYIWLTGACFSASKTLAKAAQQFGKSLKNCENLKLLVLLFDVLFGVDGFKQVVSSLPEDMTHIETFHIYNCCTEDQGNSLVELADIMKIVVNMRNLELLIVNIEQLCLSQELPELEEMKKLRYMYLQSGEESEDFDMEQSLKIMRFVRKNVGLRHLRIDFWVKWLNKEGMNVVKHMLVSLKNLELLGLKIKVEEGCEEEVIGLGYIIKKAKYLKDRFVDIVMKDKKEEILKKEAIERAYRGEVKYYNDWVRIMNEDKKEIYRSKD